MVDSETPTWGDSSTNPSSRPYSIKSNKSARSSRSQRSRQSGQNTESTPLLAREDSHPDEDADSRPRSTAASSLLRSLQELGYTRPKGLRHWPSVIALLLLCIVVVLIMVLGFVTPAAVEEYAMQAMVFEPKSLSFPELTASGVRARVQGSFSMDASRVYKKSTRDLGRFATYTAREVESTESQVEVYLPEYGNVVLGTARVPPIKVDVRNRHITPIDLLLDLEPGKVDGIRQVANDWLDGRLGQLRVKGKADVNLRSGLIHLGTQTIMHSMVFEGHDIPAIPDYNISKINIHEVDLPDASKGIAADVSLAVHNHYPIDFNVPPLGFAILVDNCEPSRPYIMLADATTSALHIKPKEDLHFDVAGVVRRLPEALTTNCPKSKRSPLDSLIADYMNGQDTTIYVRGTDSPDVHTPKWLTDLISGVTVPLPLPGHNFGGLIRNFSLTDVNFKLPNPLADPDSPDADPRISANIKVLVALPEEMNFPIDVSQVRADADVFYHGKKLGRLDLHKWQTANSSRIEGHGDDGPSLVVQAAVHNAPLEITDDGVFTDVIQQLIFGGKAVVLTIKADVDVAIKTALGALTVRKIPAAGVVPVKPISGGGFSSFAPSVGGLKIIDTSPTSFTLQAEVNFTNPTKYSATVPYVDIKILNNDTTLGHVTAENVSVMPGENRNLLVRAVWDPLTNGGPKGREVGKELLSQYISGFNTTLTLRTHKGTIPSQPALGKALEAFEVTIPTPHLRTPKQPDDGNGDDDDDKKTHFIQSATMHLFTSTAVFGILSPFHDTTLYITYLNATANYKGDPVGHIDYDLPFAIPPGLSESPRLPVEWSLGSVGYEAVRKALGGELRLKAKATVGVRIGMWEERVWFLGRGIGAKIRL